MSFKVMIHSAFVCFTYLKNLTFEENPIILQRKASSKLRQRPSQLQF